MFGKKSKKQTTKSTAKKMQSQSKSKTLTTKKATSKTAPKRPFVKYQTVWKAVGGGFSNPGESKICKVGDHKVLVTRSEKLDRYGNPIHTATVINKDGTLGDSVRSSGSATMIVSQALKKSGIDTKR